MSVLDQFRLHRDHLEEQAVLVGTGVASALVVILVIAVLIATPARMPEFSDYPAGPERKARFLDFVRPMVEEANDRVLRRRGRLQALAEQDSIGWLDGLWLDRLAEDYRIDPDEVAAAELIDILLARVDAVPLSLALAQAAKESGWGTSRFARHGYNLFGEWCYEPGCGLVPGARSEDRSHEVRAFASPRESVSSYLHNINTHRSYRELRAARTRLRAAGLPLSGLVLAEKLHRYSERGEAYVEDIKGLIRYNDLEKTSDGADT